MKGLLRNRHRLRGLLPRRVRELGYALGRGRRRRWDARPGVERVPATGQLVLTLDDGPDPDATPAVLDALARSGAQATFFVLGEQALEHPELARRIVAEGHEVGLHGSRHFRHDHVAGPESREDIERGFEQIESVTGVRPRWYRPPYGKLSDSGVNACDELGLTTVYWSAWGLDWERASAQQIAAAAARELSDGAIVLLHDSARYARRPSAQPTADAIPLIAASATDRGLRLVTLGHALGSAA